MKTTTSDKKLQLTHDTGWTPMGQSTHISTHINNSWEQLLPQPLYQSTLTLEPIQPHKTRNQPNRIYR